MTRAVNCPDDTIANLRTVEPASARHVQSLLHRAALTLVMPVLLVHAVFGSGIDGILHP